MTHFAHLVSELEACRGGASHRVPAVPLNSGSARNPADLPGERADSAIMRG
jgi:hypothetical protein